MSSTRDHESGDTRARVTAALRRGPVTAAQVAARLGLSLNAVRAQLDRLERQGVAIRRRAAIGRTKPTYLYTLSADAEQRTSRLYVPFLTQLLHVLAGRLSATDLDGVLRDTGRALLPPALPHGSLGDRVAAATELLNGLGGLATAEREGDDYRIRSLGCPLAATTAEYPETCKAVESLLAEYLDVPVTLCCDYTERPRCCFTVAAAASA